MHPSRGRVATVWQGRKVRGTVAKSGKTLSRRVGLAFSGSNCPDPFPAAARPRLGPLARYTAAASIIPNYNNKCKSGITTREPGNKVSPGAHSRLRARSETHTLPVSVLKIIVSMNHTTLSLSRDGHIKPSARVLRFLQHVSCHIQ